jgi:hypothetical protein
MTAGQAVNHDESKNQQGEQVASSDGDKPSN